MCDVHNTALLTLTDSSLDFQSRLSTLETRFRLLREHKESHENEHLRAELQQGVQQQGHFRAELDATRAELDATRAALCTLQQEVRQQGHLRAELDATRAALRALHQQVQQQGRQHRAPTAPCAKCHGCCCSREGAGLPPAQAFAALEGAAASLSAAVAASSGAAAEDAAGSALRGAAAAARAAAEAQAGLAALAAHVAADVAAVGGEAGEARRAAEAAAAAAALGGGGDFKPTLAPTASPARRGDPGPVEVPSYLALMADARVMRGLLAAAAARRAEAPPPGPSPAQRALEAALELMAAYDARLREAFAREVQGADARARPAAGGGGSSSERERKARRARPVAALPAGLLRGLCLPAPLLTFLRMAMEASEAELATLGAAGGLLRAADAPVTALGPAHAPWAPADRLRAPAGALDDLARLFSPEGEGGAVSALARALQAE